MADSSSAATMLDCNEVKGHGIHYTPPELAGFLARRVVAQLDLSQPELTVLDPACGDGELLAAIAQVVGTRVPRLTLVGVDRDADALARAEAALSTLDTRIELAVADFLDLATRQQLELSPESQLSDVIEGRSFDAVVSNPPYVRTQVLGAPRARALAERFQLAGRLDLYQAFVRAMTPSLRLGGVLGLLCSNRFLTIQAGATLRDLLDREFELCELFDLGDTKLFAAAVLPAIVIARRVPDGSKRASAFTRAYEYDGLEEAACEASSIVAALDQGLEGIVSANGRRYEIERGDLKRPAARHEPWRITHADRERWLSRVGARTECTFADIGNIRVGIKTTADRVFIRETWDDLPAELAPEAELLHPLITHHVAARWRALDLPGEPRRVLYPHVAIGGKRRTIDLDQYPRARAYLESNREALMARKYVIDAGRSWYEIWVPQQPDDWARAKVVFPDISDRPRFFLDTSGAIVNGDCYWMAVDNELNPELTSLVLAVANSSFAIAYYDAVCGNRLYAGRRRFITQYVMRFPIPSLGIEDTQALHALVQRLRTLSTDETDVHTQLEAELDALVWEGFGLREEA